MTSAHENGQKNYFELEDALQTYPIKPAPAGFSKKVMEKVHASTPTPQFQLSWFDYALTFFCTSMVGLVLFLRQFIPTQWIMLVRFQAFVLWERGTRFPYTPDLFVGCALAFLAILFAFIFLKRPRFVTSSQ